MNQFDAARKPSIAVVQESSQSHSSTQSSVDIKYLIRALVKYNASDLHIKVGRPPLYRINGKIVPVKMPDMTQETVDQVLFSILTPIQRKELETKKEINVSFLVKDIGRFRCNIYYQLGNIAAAIRMIPLVVPSFEELKIPTILKEVCQRPNGLFLITGSSGAGKSTTMAAMIQHINENNHVHILSIEDPIEFVYRDLKATITQREVGTDTLNFQEGLRAGLRQDPDVIIIGELRDLDMIQTALTAAETGHLVMATLHTNNAKSTLNRIFDVFPAEAHQQLRIQLASSLIGVISQQLLLRADNSGRIPASEVMIKSPVIEEYIRKGELDAIPEAIANSNNHYKMQTMNQALERLVKEGFVTLEEALKASDAPDNLRLAISEYGKNSDEQSISIPLERY